LIAATILADLGKETKAVDIALLHSFLSDPRVCFILIIIGFKNFVYRFWYELNVVIH
jgi:membrane-bound ClpP family serine protease